jgi:hypothetical protein
LLAEHFGSFADFDEFEVIGSAVAVITARGQFDFA